MWKFIALFVILGIGIPILMSIYTGFLNTTNGSWLNWTVENATHTGNITAYSTFEFGIFQFIPIIATLFAIIFILILVSGVFRKKDASG